MFMRANQFNLKDLFLSTALIAVGLGMAVLPFSDVFRDGKWYFLLLPQALWHAGGALIDTGIFHPFKKAAIGAVIGVAVQVVIFYTYFIPLESLF
jgi:hypothetical protein